MDIFTFSLGDTEGKIELRRENELNDLLYELDILQWGPSSFEIDLNGRYRGTNFDHWRVSGPFNRTAVAISRRAENTIFLAFTPLASMPLMEEAKGKRLGDRDGLVNPTVLEREIPSHPDPRLKGTYLVEIRFFMTR